MTDTTQPNPAPAATPPAPVAVARSAFVIQKPGEPPMYYVSPGNWNISALKAATFATITAALRTARTFQLSGVKVKRAMTPEQVAAQAQAIADVNAQQRAKRAARLAAKAARKLARSVKTGIKPDPGSLGMPAPGQASPAPT